MNINLGKITDLLDVIIDATGTEIQTLTRVTSGSDAYSTGSTTTYGYGDPTVYWVTGSEKVIITHVSANDVVLETGFYAEDYERIQLRSDSNVEFWDQVIIPSGSGIRYIVLPPHNIYGEGQVIAKYAIVRRLVPRQEGAY